MAYDIVMVGGGLGGSALARAMAEKGRRVLVLESETKFRDRVRGEQVTSWGTAEAKELGIFDLLASSCAAEEVWWDIFLNGMQIQHRNMVESTGPQTPNMTFFHPEMQETLLKAAEDAGAEVRRGAQVRGVEPGEKPAVLFEQDGKEERAEARLVVGADGRNSMVRKWAGFEVHREPDDLQIGGIIMEDCVLPMDTAHVFFNPAEGIASPIFPQPGKRARLYFVSRVDCGVAHSGEKDLPVFLEGCARAGVDASLLKAARYTGPLATFKGAASWVEHPYKNGVALIGDAAGHSDPAWGQGLSLTMRDARVLRDKLLENDDWDAAGHAYAKAEHDYFMASHTVEGWFSKFFYGIGPEADARRAQALPGMAQNPEIVPDHMQSGPECEPADESVRRRFFGEE